MARMTLMLITNDPDIALHALSAGVDRLFVDMETRGKSERQGGLDTHMAAHTPRDVEVLRSAAPGAEILVRVNPLYSGTADEIDAVTAAGADVVMLPMFRTAEEVEQFLDLVGRRARSSLLLETPQAMVRVDQILEHADRIDEIHVGLNDLHLGMDLDFMFELLSGGIVEHLSHRIRGKGVRFGFGGIARLGEGAVPAEVILGEHVRLGSEMVVLSRTFHGRAATVAELGDSLDLAVEVGRVRTCVRRFESAPAEELERNRDHLVRAVRNVVRSRREAGVKAGGAR